MTACPACAGPVELSASAASGIVGYEVMPEEFPTAVEAATKRALWSAIKALEDTASQARWRMQQPSPPESLWRVAVECERDAAVLRKLQTLRHRIISDVPAQGRHQLTSDTGDSVLPNDLRDPGC